MVRTKLVTLTLSPKCDQHRERDGGRGGGLMRAGSPFDFFGLRERKRQRNVLCCLETCPRHATRDGGFLCLPYLIQLQR